MAFTYDTKVQVAASVNNPVTTNFTCGASAKLLVVTLIYAYGTRTGAPTYNSVALTQADQVRNHSASPEACAEVWYMLAPPTGSSYQISVPNPNTLSLEAVVSSYNTASGYCAQFHAATGGNNASANPSVSITPTQNNALIVAVVGDGHDTFAPSARSGTSLYETDNGTWGGGHQYFIQTTAAAKAMSWTQASDDWGCCVAAFVEVRQGVGVSKANVYAVAAPKKGVDVSKANVYVVTAPPKGVSVSKANVYAVLEGDVKVAQVAEEIVYTTDAAPVQVAQTAEEIVYTTDAAPVQVAQVAQEIVLADYTEAQVAQEAFETLVLPTDADIQVAQEAFEVLTLPTDADIQVAQYAIEVLVKSDSDFVAQIATEVMIQPTSQLAQVAQVAHEVMVQPTSQQAQVAQTAYEVMITDWQTVTVAQVATEVIIEASWGPYNATVAHVATEIVAQNPPRAIISHTAVEAVIQNFVRAQVAHTAVEIIAGNMSPVLVAHTAVEVIAKREAAVIYGVATEIVRKNMNWVFTAHVATEVPITGPAGAPGDTMVTQMKLSVLQEGGGIIRGSQVTRGTTIRADEDLMISHVVRATVIHKKRDFWPALIRMLGGD